MNSFDVEIKFQACNLCDALHRNINDNFESVSFDVNENGEIQVLFILVKKSNSEAEYIDDIMAEFEVQQLKDCVNKPLVLVGKSIRPLSFLVYQKKETAQL